MTLEDLDYNLNIDYCGSYIDKESEKELPAVCLRLYVLKQKGTEDYSRRYGVNISGDPAAKLEDAVASLQKTFKRWFMNKFKEEVDITGELMSSSDLKNKFTRWTSATPIKLQQAKTIEVSI